MINPINVKPQSGRIAFGVAPDGSIQPLQTDASGNLLQSAKPTVLFQAQPTIGTGYTIGQCMGGLITITGLVAGQTYNLGGLRVFINGTLTAISSIEALVMNANPSGSTFTDAQAAVLATADLPKAFYYAAPNAAGVSSVQNFAGWVISGAGGSARAVADGSGQLYVALIAGGTFTLASQHMSVNVELDPQ